MYNQSSVASSSSLTTEGHNYNALSCSEEISEAQRPLLTRVMQTADAKNNSVAPQAETVPLQAEDCSRVDLAVARTSRVEEEEEQKSEEARVRVRGRRKGRKAASTITQCYNVV